MEQLDDLGVLELKRHLLHAAALPWVSTTVDMIKMWECPALHNYTTNIYS